MAVEWLTTIIDWLLISIESWGYLGIFILMTLESTFIPIPSEAVMIPAGVLAASGKLNIILALLTGIAGSIVGALINYYLALYLGRKIIVSFLNKYGKYFLLSMKSLDKTEQFFKNHGPITTFIGRLIPVIRHLVSIPAGFAKMNLTSFISYTALGAGLWCAILIGLGFILQTNRDLISQYLSQITYATLGVCLLLIIAYIWNQKRKANKTKR